MDGSKTFQRKGRQHFFRNSVGNCLCQCRNLRNITNRLLFQDFLNGLDIQQITDGVILTNGLFIFKLFIGNGSKILCNIKRHHRFYKLSNSLRFIALYTILCCALCFKTFLFLRGQTARTLKLMVKRFFFLLSREQLCS